MLAFHMKTSFLNCICFRNGIMMNLKYQKLKDLKNLMLTQIMITKKVIQNEREEKVENLVATVQIVKLPVVAVVQRYSF